MNLIQLGTEQIEYVRVDPRPRQVRVILRWKDGTLHVSAPKHIGQRAIEQVILQHTSWILKQREVTQDFTRRNILIGDGLSIRGVTFRLCAVDHDNRIGIHWGQHTLKVPSTWDDRRRQHMVHRFLRQLADQELRKQTTWWIDTCGLRPERITVKEQARRWGSCSSRRNINLNWRLIGAPYEVASYVIVHELAHLEQLNHGPLFWDIVRKWLPNFEASRVWLRKHGERLYDFGEEGILIRDGANQ